MESPERIGPEFDRGKHDITSNIVPFSNPPTSEDDVRKFLMATTDEEKLSLFGRWVVIALDALSKETGRNDQQSIRSIMQAAMLWLHQLLSTRWAELTTTGDITRRFLALSVCHLLQRIMGDKVTLESFLSTHVGITPEPATIHYLHNLLQTSLTSLPSPTHSDTVSPTRPHDQPAGDIPAYHVFRQQPPSLPASDSGIAPPHAPLPYSDTSMQQSPQPILSTSALQTPPSAFYTSPPAVSSEQQQRGPNEAVQQQDSGEADVVYQQLSKQLDNLFTLATEKGNSAISNKVRNMQQALLQASLQHHTSPTAQPQPHSATTAYSSNTPPQQQATGSQRPPSSTSSASSLTHTPTSTHPVVPNPPSSSSGSSGGDISNSPGLDELSTLLESMDKLNERLVKLSPRPVSPPTSHHSTKTTPLQPQPQPHTHAHYTPPQARHSHGHTSPPHSQVNVSLFQGAALPLDTSVSSPPRDRRSPSPPSHPISRGVPQQQPNVTYRGLGGFSTGNVGQLNGAEIQLHESSNRNSIQSTEFTERLDLTYKFYNSIIYGTNGFNIRVKLLASQVEMKDEKLHDLLKDKQALQKEYSSLVETMSKNLPYNNNNNNSSTVTSTSSPPRTQTTENNLTAQQAAVIDKLRDELLQEKERMAREVRDAQRAVEELTAELIHKDRVLKAQEDNAMSIAQHMTDNERHSLLLAFETQMKEQLVRFEKERDEMEQSHARERDKVISEFDTECKKLRDEANSLLLGRNEKDLECDKLKREMQRIGDSCEARVAVAKAEIQTLQYEHELWRSQIHNKLEEREREIVHLREDLRQAQDEAYLRNSARIQDGTHPIFVNVECNTDTELSLGSPKRLRGRSPVLQITENGVQCTILDEHGQIKLSPSRSRPTSPLMQTSPSHHMTSNVDYSLWPRQQLLLKIDELSHLAQEGQKAIIEQRVAEERWKTAEVDKRRLEEHIDLLEQQCLAWQQEISKWQKEYESLRLQYNELHMYCIASQSHCMDIVRSMSHLNPNENASERESHTPPPQHKDKQVIADMHNTSTTSSTTSSKTKEQVEALAKQVIEAQNQAADAYRRLNAQQAQVDKLSSELNETQQQLEREKQEREKKEQQRDVERSSSSWTVVQTPQYDPNNIDATNTDKPPITNTTTTMDVTRSTTRIPSPPIEHDPYTSIYSQPRIPTPPSPLSLSPSHTSISPYTTTMTHNQHVTMPAPPPQRMPTRRGQPSPPYTRPNALPRSTSNNSNLMGLGNVSTTGAPPPPPPALPHAGGGYFNSLSLPPRPPSHLPPPGTKQSTTTTTNTSSGSRHVSPNSTTANIGSGALHSSPTHSYSSRGGGHWQSQPFSPSTLPAEPRYFDDPLGMHNPHNSSSTLNLPPSTAGSGILQQAQESTSTMNTPRSGFTIPASSTNISHSVTASHTPSSFYPLNHDIGGSNNLGMPSPIMAVTPLMNNMSMLMTPNQSLMGETSEEHQRKFQRFLKKLQRDYKQQISDLEQQLVSAREYINELEDTKPDPCSPSSVSVSSMMMAANTMHPYVFNPQQDVPTMDPSQAIVVPTINRDTTRSPSRDTTTVTKSRRATSPVHGSGGTVTEETTVKRSVVTPTQQRRGSVGGHSASSTTSQPSTQHQQAVRRRHQPNEATKMGWNTVQTSSAVASTNTTNTGSHQASSSGDHPRKVSKTETTRTVRKRSTGSATSRSSSKASRTHSPTPSASSSKKATPPPPPVSDTIAHYTWQLQDIQRRLARVRASPKRV